MWTNRRSVGSLDSPSRSMCSGSCSQATMKRTDWDHICGCLILQQLPTMLTPCGRSTLEQGLPWPGRQLGCGKQRCIWPRAACGWKSRDHAHGGHLHRQRIRRSPDLWWRPTATADDPVCAQSHEGLTCPIAHLLNRSGISEAGRSDQLWGTKSLRPEGMFMQGRRRYWW